MLTLTILGNNSAIPAFGRHPTSQLLQYEEQGMLIDCGEGTQMQLSKYKLKISKISHIFISHLHGDHYFGLIGLLTTMSLLNRKESLEIHGPAGLKEIIDIHLKVADMNLGYPLEFRAILQEGLITDTRKITVEAFKVQHKIECWGFIFREKKKPRSIDPEKAKAFHIPPSYYERLQKGDDFINEHGITIANATVTNMASGPRSYAFCADSIYDESLAAKVKNVSLLYHETTYLKDLSKKAEERYHSTSEQAALIARKANVGKLIIGHFSAKYEHLEPFLLEASAVFKSTVLAIEGCCYKV